MWHTKSTVRFLTHSRSHCYMKIIHTMVMFYVWSILFLLYHSDLQTITRFNLVTNSMAHIVNVYNRHSFSLFLSLSLKNFKLKIGAYHLTEKPENQIFFLKTFCSGKRYKALCLLQSPNTPKLLPEIFTVNKCLLTRRLHIYIWQTPLSRATYFFSFI